MDNPFIPDHIKGGLTVKQAEWLCFLGLEGLFGGSAGPGKSVGLLAAGLQFIEEPGYHALVLRRTFKQLSMADSILAKAKEWLLANPRVRYNGDDHKFTFPHGNTLQFGHMEHEDSKYNYQGGVWAFVGVDECTQFTETQITYPRTRIRRVAGSRIPMRWRGATNPGGPSHEFIKRRYIKDENGKDPSTPDRQFFPAKIDDNPNLDREEYVKQLKESGIDGLLLDQLLRGDWDAVPGGRFRREWFESYRWRGDYCLADGRAEFKPKECRRNGSSPCDPAASISNDGRLRPYRLGASARGPIWSGSAATGSRPKSPTSCPGSGVHTGGGMRPMRESKRACRIGPCSNSPAATPTR
jgi:hypothetical protein